MSDCFDGCRKNLDKGAIDAAGMSTCTNQCLADFGVCTDKIKWDTATAGKPPTQLGPTLTPFPTNPTGLPITKNPPPNAVGANPTASPTPQRHPIRPPRKLGPNPTPSPTPRRNPIKGPPHRLGPSPSPTAHPILLAKPTSPTPSPSPGPKKRSNSHGHH
jgi:hypothetical protein